MLVILRIAENGCILDFSRGSDRELVFERRGNESFAQVTNRALTEFAEKVMEIARERDIQEAKDA